MTNKNRYFDQNTRYLTAILEVKHILPNHREACRYYSEHKMPVPSNCVVRSNPPLSLKNSAGLVWLAGIKKTNRRYRRWKALYSMRAKQQPLFAVCTPIYRNLNDPQRVTEENLREAFGRIPGTQNPPRISRIEYQKLLRIMGLQDLL
jgi:hypothetical protein